MNKLIKSVLSSILVLSLTILCCENQANALTKYSSASRNPYACKFIDYKFLLSHGGIRFSTGTASLKDLRIRVDVNGVCREYKVSGKLGKIANKNVWMKNIDSYRYTDSLGRTIDCVFTNGRTKIFPEIRHRVIIGKKAVKIVGIATYTGELKITLSGYKVTKNFSQVIDVKKGKKFSCIVNTGGTDVETLTLEKPATDSTNYQYWEYRVVEKKGACPLRNEKASPAQWYVRVYKG